MVISNPGGLPAGMVVSDLLREPHDSLPRNPILAQVFYYAKLVEQWGSGTIKMRNACRAQGVPDPVFESTTMSFTVTLRKDEFSSKRLGQIGLNARQVQIIDYIHRNGSASNGECQTLTEAPRRTVTRDLEQLVDAGFLTRSAHSGRTVRYVLAKLSNAP